jgi:hypothetical protein
MNMRASILFACAFVIALSTVGCADDTVVATGQIIVRYDETAPFETYRTFSVLTPDLVPDAPATGDDEELFNELVNDFIIEAMQAEPVCMTFIPTDELDENDPPDLFAGNGVARETEKGYYWQCIGGWWWGYWGWYWDPCKWVAPVPVEYDVGSMLIPVGPPPAAGEGATPIFAGLAQSLLAAGIDETAVEQAVRAIFQQWPEKRQCSAEE